MTCLVKKKIISVNTTRPPRSTFRPSAASVQMLVSLLVLGQPYRHYQNLHYTHTNHSLSWMVHYCSALSCFSRRITWDTFCSNNQQFYTRYEIAYGFYSNSTIIIIDLISWPECINRIVFTVAISFSTRLYFLDRSCKWFKTGHALCIEGRYRQSRALDECASRAVKSEKAASTGTSLPVSAPPRS